MKIIESTDVPSEKDEKTSQASFIKEFQLSPHYGVIMEIIQDAIDKSLVQELISKKNGDVNETEVGRLTIIEWAVKQRVEKIKQILTKKYD